MVSPVDGTVLHFGLANGYQIEQVSFNQQNKTTNIHFVCYFNRSSRLQFKQVKGINYNLQHFLGPMNGGSKDGSSMKLHNSEVQI